LTVFYWLLPRFTGFSIVLLAFFGFSGFYQVLVSAWSYNVILGFIGFYCISLGFTGFYWVLPGFTLFNWVLLGVTGNNLGFYGFLSQTLIGSMDSFRTLDASAGHQQPNRRVRCGGGAPLGGSGRQRHHRSGWL